jgi:hypothetical protein
MVTSIQVRETRAHMDGLWTAEFGSSVGLFGGGAVVLQDGRIMGGDGSYYYLGEYTIDGLKFKATIRVSPFIAGAESAFKTAGRELTLDLAGTLTDEQHVVAQGGAREVPDVGFGVKLTKRT